MSDFLGHLAARALDLPSTLTPRTASMFEPSSSGARDELLPEIELELEPDPEASPDRRPAARAHDAAWPSIPEHGPSRASREERVTPEGDTVASEHGSFEPLESFEPVKSVRGRATAVTTRALVPSESEHAVPTARGSNAWMPEESHEEREVHEQHEERVAPHRPNAVRRLRGRLPERKPGSATAAETEAIPSPASHAEFARSGERLQVRHREGDPPEAPHPDARASRRAARNTVQAVSSGEEPSISISIGRIDVRASTPAAAAPAPRATRNQVMPLEAYLRQRSQRNQRSGS